MNIFGPLAVNQKKGIRTCKVGKFSVVNTCIQLYDMYIVMIRLRRLSSSHWWLCLPKLVIQFSHKQMYKLHPVLRYIISSFKTTLCFTPMKYIYLVLDNIRNIYLKTSSSPDISTISSPMWSCLPCELLQGVTTKTFILKLSECKWNIYREEILKWGRRILSNTSKLIVN